MDRKVSAVFNLIMSLVLVGLALLAAGTLNWPRFWFFLGFYVAATSALMLWLKRRHPGLLKERMTARKDAKGWDKAIIRIYTVILIVMFLLAPLDAVRFRWSRVPAAAAWAAFAVIFLAWAVVLWAFRENAFLAGFVRIQSDRGHTVCTTGPYRLIRHPMYLAVILVVLCLPVFLGSLYSLIPAALVVVLFVLRTSLEDRTLQKELPGYADYAARTRWKLIPGLW